jgi:hypothetical protein
VQVFDWIGGVMVKTKVKANLKAKAHASDPLEIAVERLGDLLTEREDGGAVNWDAEVRKILKKLIKAVTP